MAVVILFVGPLVRSIGDGQNYAKGRHIGCRIRSALISSIYHKAMTVDLAGSKESVGKLNNLISVDVGDLQSFCCYTHYMWASLLEIIISTSLLFMVLGTAAWGGIVVMVASLYFGHVVQRRMEIYQTDILVNKDKRMGIINEVLNSIRVIKLYAWEEKFMQKITDARTMELSSLSSYCICQSLMMVVYETVPALVGVAAFVTHTHLLGLPLSPSTGFTALALFNLLREPLTDFPGMLNWLVKANVAL
eukprot:gene25989-32504_t